MNDKCEFERYYQRYRANNIKKYISRKLFGKEKNEIKNEIAGHVIMSEDDGNARIAERIENGEPFCAVRFGSVEAEAINTLLRFENGCTRKPDQEKIRKLKNNAGFFCTEEKEERCLVDFLHLMEESARSIDMLGIWTDIEEYMLQKYIPIDSNAIRMKSLEPYYFQGRNPWSSKLEGKKVLVIHPFAETIERQYANHKYIFKDPTVLPDFELHTIKAVQTIVGTKDDRFVTWFEALEWMYQEALKIDFDIAIIGCGAYGLPLAVKIRNSGHQAIHMGGGTQLLFGINGKRWDLHFPEIVEMYNDYWVRATQEETPLRHTNIEDQGCYW